MKPLLPAAIAVLAASAPPASAGALADPAELDRAVAAFTGAAAGEPGGARAPLDRRLRLAACAAAPLAEWYGTRGDVVQLRCPGGDGWRLFVPVLAGGGAAGAAAMLVNRGDTVAVIVAGDGFAVTQPGEALDSGAAGAWIRVRPGGASARPLRAQVTAPGEARLAAQ